MIICLKLECLRPKTPSRTTGIFWIKKVGYYCLHKEKEKARDWIFILDESIGIGQEKLLVILGIRRSHIDFTRPLQLQDMEPLLVKSKTSWTGEDISKELEKCKKQVGSVIYATTDGGSSLKKALRLSHISHVYDLTHAVAIMLEKLYKEDAEFKSFTGEMNQMRLKWCCSQYAHLIPPNQRSKSRFLNIDILSCWGMKVLQVLKKNCLSEKEKSLLQWVMDKKDFIEEMHQLIHIIEELSIVLKNTGLSKSSYKTCKQILCNCNPTPRQIRFKKLFRDYLDKNIKEISQRKESLLCSSDIIECTFGRYKNELNENPMSGITDLALIIPALTSSLTETEIKNAIDGCTCQMIKDWRKENLCESLSVKRNLIFKQ